MKISTAVTILLVTLVASIPAVLEAYATGAGSCLAGQAGVGQPHLKGQGPTYNTQVVTGKLSTGGFKVTIDGVALSPSVTKRVTIKKSHIVKVTGGTFRGFNIRLGLFNPNALLPISGDTKTKTNNYCQAYQAVGITHNSNTTKTSVSGKLISSVASSNVPLDITIVVQNRAKKSVYYFTRFLLTFA